MFTTIDRGYTAAEERYRNNSLGAADGNATDLLKGIGAHFSSAVSLNELIRSSLQQYGGGGRGKWLPIDKLFELVNESLVYQELLRAFGEHLCQDKISELRDYAKKICADITYLDHAGNTLKSSRRSIFAILTLMDKVQDAPKFVDAELSDKDLPLNWRTKPGTKDHEFYSTFIPNKTWTVGQTWRENVFDSFLGYQKLMLSPFFALKTVSFHDLDPDAVLPFIEDEHNIRHRQGHHGSVWRVKIHPAHHDAHEVLLSTFFSDVID